MQGEVQHAPCCCPDLPSRASVCSTEGPGLAPRRPPYCNVSLGRFGNKGLLPSNRPILAPPSFWHPSGMVQGVWGTTVLPAGRCAGPGGAALPPAQRTWEAGMLRQPLMHILNYFFASWHCL